MIEINLIELGGTNFQVTVISSSTTTHLMTVQTDYAQKLTGAKLALQNW